MPAAKAAGLLRRALARTLAAILRVAVRVGHRGCFGCLGRVGRRRVGDLGKFRVFRLDLRAFVNDRFRPLPA
ncbi:hypothetical protein, partial [Burkholderia cenocepacia]|uniref:hypothetical protein n=1 Tax=Burkholderia cenocepacia TaxID=95486 RepID=UPI0024B6AA32